MTTTTDTTYNGYTNYAMYDNLEEQDWAWILADGEDIWDALAPYSILAQDEDDDER